VFPVVAATSLREHLAPTTGYSASLVMSGVMFAEVTLDLPILWNKVQEAIKMAAVHAFGDFVFTSGLKNSLMIKWLKAQLFKQELHAAKVDSANITHSSLNKAHLLGPITMLTFWARQSLMYGVTSATYA